MVKSGIRRRRRWRGVLLILTFVGLLTYLGYQVYPYGYALLKGEPYLNPRVKTRSDETYQLEMWVKLPVLADTGPAREMLERSIAEFTVTRPNFEINITYLPEAQAMERLHLALQTGEPPDLFFHADSSQNYYGELQIPLEIYLGQQERLAWPEPVWQQAVVNNRLYALPIALYPRVMLMNTALWQPTLCSQADVMAAGWNWDQFLQCANEASKDKVHGYVPTSVGDAFLASMLATWGQPAALKHDGSPVWTREQLVSIAEAWTQLNQSKAVPSPPDNMDSDCLSQFLNKKAASIGPLNHHLAKWLWENASKAGITPAFWPMPSQTGKSDLRGIHLVAFRQSAYQGHRHTKATAELALYLASELAGQMHKLTGAVPAQSHLLTDLNLPFSQESLAVYTDLSKVLPVAYAYGPEPGIAAKHWEHTIAPAWTAFVTGQYTADEFAEAVITGLLRATITGP